MVAPVKPLACTRCGRPSWYSNSEGVCLVCTSPYVPSTPAHGHKIRPRLTAVRDAFVTHPLMSAASLPHGPSQIVASPDMNGRTILVSLSELLEHPDRYLAWVECEDCR